MPSPISPVYSPEEAEARDEMLKKQPEEQLRQWLKEATTTIGEERENYQSVCRDRSWFSKLMSDPPEMSEMVMGKVVDECYGAIAAIRGELARRGVELESDEA